MTLLTVSLVLFCATALGGAVLARAHWKGARPPGAVVIGHPLLAASGLILLSGSYVRSDGATLLAAALFVLVGAAAGGVGLVVLRIKRGSVPFTAIALHALVALSGIALVAIQLAAARSDVPPPVPAEREKPAVSLELPPEPPR